MQIVEVNYDAGRPYNTFSLNSLSMYDNFFPTYPRNVLQNMNIELAKIAIIQKNKEILLRLPHRQFVFNQVAWPSRSRRLRPGFPKALRVFFRHDRRFFAEISKMIFTVISDFYRDVTD